jgi:hypothetical protein
MINCQVMNSILCGYYGRLKVKILSLLKPTYLKVISEINMNGGSIVYALTEDGFMNVKNEWSHCHGTSQP